MPEQFYLSLSTKNLFRVEWIKDGKVKLANDGHFADLDDLGDCLMRDGVPAVVSISWLVNNPTYVPLVRLFGGSFMREDDYYNEPRFEIAPETRRMKR